MTTSATGAPNGNPVNQPSPTTVANLIYLSWVGTFYTSAGSVVGTTSIVFNIYGGYTTGTTGNSNPNSVIGNPTAIGTVSGDGLSSTVPHSAGYAVYVLSSPYTFIQAVANANALLANIDLENAARVYIGVNYDAYGDTENMNFCFASEASAYTHTTSTLFVTWDTSGNIIYNTVGFTSPSPGGTYYTWPGDLTGTNCPWNGFMTTQLSNGNYYCGFILCKKGILRSNVGQQFNTQNNTFFDTSTGKYDIFSTFIFFPTLSEAGVYFTPSMVPGYGKSQFNYTAIKQTGAGQPGTGAGQPGAGAGGGSGGL